MVAENMMTNDNNVEKNNKPNDNKNNKISMKTILMLAMILITVILIVNLVLERIQTGKVQDTTYSQFLLWISEEKIEKVTLKSDTILIELKDEIDGTKSYSTERISNDDTLIDKLEDAKIKFKSDAQDDNSLLLNVLLSYILPVALFMGFMYLIFRGLSKSGVMGNVGKSTAKIYVEKKTGVTFADVAGQDESKESLTEMVDFLHNPSRYLKIGAKLPKGALLVGPPGTGKTLLAKAVAGEANVPFFSLSGSDFIEMFVGVGASRVRDLFKQAQQMAPCIIFIDEIDAIGRSRDGRGGSDSEREQTLNQLLSEMDGFDTSKGIVILAATNRPEVLDKALLRPGRFDRRIVVEKPDLKGRIDTLKVHAKDVLLDQSVDFKEVALATAGGVGSDLANIINEGALAAVKAGRETVSQADLLEAVEVVFAGKEKKDRLLNKKEKRIVAYHEIGHALVMALQKNTEPVQKITIVPRTMGALGYVLSFPEEEKYLQTEPELLESLVSTLGGRASEQIKFGIVTTGAANDIEQATSTARQMVTRFGMSDKFGLICLETIEDQYLEGRRVLNCAERTEAQVDEEVVRMLKEAYEKAYKLLKDNEDLLDALAEYLVEKETITGKEFMRIFKEIRGEDLKENKSDIELELEESCVNELSEDVVENNVDDYLRIADESENV